ncbi:MAG: PA0069 family radical SAM protein [Hyphomicrobiaceae bacterium]|nr:PA0069 family radical SAM protein [Hyphomicrobiaceae bacterium]
MPRHVVAEESGRRGGESRDGRLRGRGARSNRSGRYEALVVEEADDGWGHADEPAKLRTEVQLEQARTIITRNDSPDISFDQSINPYRGCEHGCSYCYARPSHCYLGHSAGLDFESKLYAKPGAAALLRRELAAPRYAPRTIALGTNTDPYQPIEREHGLTRQLLEVMVETRHPVGIVTKSALILRDLDLLAELARRDLVKVAISVTTLDRVTARKMEPRASTPAKRLEAIARLAEAGIPTAVMVAPVVPAINDSEIEAILGAASDAGAREAGYVLLRLPLEIKELFREWLATEFPDRARRVITLMRSMHGGRDYSAQFGVRQRGRGPFAEQIAARFRLALKRCRLNERRLTLRTDLFEPPSPGGDRQLSLF